MRALSKRLLGFAVGGILFGWVVSSLLMPTILIWYVTPGTQATTMCNCVELASETVRRIVRGQLFTMGIGLVLGIVLGFVFDRRARRRALPNA